MKTLVTSALILATLSGAALASSATSGVNPGDAQLARIAGVEPGEFSRNELIAIIEAQRENDSSAVNFYLSGANRGSASANDNAGLEQLARLAGVEPGLYTANELVTIIDAQREDDTAKVNYYLSGANRQGESGLVTPGKAQLAAIAGVNPADYTLAELVAMQPTADD
ncbi:MAG: hypothetical protein RIR62_2165 [Pseudomonadota bacterium]|jgi:hypothetical protein